MESRVAEWMVEHMRARLVGVLVALMLVTVLMPVASASAVTTFTISGTLVDQAGDPIVGAEVSLWDAADEFELPPAATTGANGEFTLGPVANGDYIVEYPGTFGIQYVHVTVAGANITGVEVVDAPAPPADGKGTITVLDNLTGMPIVGAWVTDDGQNYADVNGEGVARYAATTSPFTVSAVGYLPYVVTTGLAEGQNLVVKLTLESGYGVLKGLLRDKLSQAAISRDPDAGDDLVVGTIYTFDGDAQEFIESDWIQGGKDGSFSCALKVSEVKIRFSDEKHFYADEWYKDAQFMSKATPVNVAPSAATSITADLDLAASVSGTIASTGGWKAALTEYAGQYGEAWAFNEKDLAWQQVTSFDCNGPNYSAYGLPAGTYKLLASLVYADPQGNPFIVNGDLFTGAAWYKSGTSIKVTSYADQMAKISQAQTVTVGASEQVTGVDFVIPRVASTVTRVAGANRFDVAAGLARKGWDPLGDKTWEGVYDVIIANGDDGREADPLGAAGLAGMYDCPVLLTQATRTPLATKTALTEIAKANPGVRIHIIGGTGSVPDARWYEMKAIKGVSTTKDRIAGATRYDVSAGIAKRMVALNEGAPLPAVLIVAGDNALGFYDALAASPLSFANAMPMLCVQKGAVPAPIAALLGTTLKGVPRYMVNSTAYVSDATRVKAGAYATRLTTSSNRYTAAAQIASAGISKGWATPGNTAVAAKLPDALTGGVYSGKNGGVMLFTDSTSVLQPATKSFITARKTSIVRGWVLGGTGSVPAAQETSFRSLLK